MESHMARFRLRQPSKNTTTVLETSIAQSITELSAGRITSCDRCRQFKKKCSRTPPECTICVKAGVECSLGVFAYVVGLQAQSAWMDRSLGQKNKPWKDLPANRISGQSNTTEVINKRTSTTPIPVLDAPDVAIPRGPITQSSQLTDNESTITEDVIREPPPKRVRLENPDHHARNLGESPQQSHYSSPAETSSLSSRRALVDAYFRDVHRAYPFVDRSRVVTALRLDSSSMSISSEENDVDAIMLYLIMAIGHNTLQRAGHVPSDNDTSFEIKYKDIVSRCLVQESTDTVRILLLLAIYSLVDPHGYSTWSLVDIAARQTVRLGLNRRDCADEGLLPSEAERGHRLFWSVYVFDRMAATSIGIPPIMNDVDIDIPLPGLTVEEFASPERMEHISTLQAARHIIQLRQLEDKVLKQLNDRNRIRGASSSFSASRSTLAGLRTEIENWYSSGCLLKSAETDDVTIHITISWLAARYYNLLLYLYYPSEPGSTVAQISGAELVGLAQKHIQANAVRFQQRQLPLNRATLYRLIPVCLIFLHCFITHGSGEPFSAGEEIGICADIMEAYSAEWSEARRGAAIMRQLASLTTNAATPRPGAFSSTYSRPFSEADRAWCHAIKVSLIQLAQEVLGSGSVYVMVKGLWGQGNDGLEGGRSLIKGPFQDGYQPITPTRKGEVVRQEGIQTNTNASTNSPGADPDGFTSGGFHIIDLL
ncbi:fungal-specific transcription factor domain-containing protein [Hypomontagnella monticulosa]|nr:fungal-specific transcription factor domain-containing protein [Hypomontagnella monticulosa]